MKYKKLIEDFIKNKSQRNLSFGDCSEYYPDLDSFDAEILKCEIVNEYGSMFHVFSTYCRNTDKYGVTVCKVKGIRYGKYVFEDKEE